MARIRMLRRLCGRKRPVTLDVACAEGEDLLALAPYLGPAVGVDALATRVEQARRAALDMNAGNLRFAIGDAIAFHVDGTVPRDFDLILVRDVLEEWADPYHLMSAVKRRLHRDGRAVVIQPHGRHPAVLWCRWLAWREAVGERPRGLTPEQVRGVARRAGLEPISFEALPWVPATEEEHRVAARGPLINALARLRLAADNGAFAMVLRHAR